MVSGMEVERIGPVEFAMRRGDLTDGCCCSTSFSGAVLVRGCNGGRFLLPGDATAVSSGEKVVDDCAVGVMGPAVDGVRDAAAERVCASATACEREGSVTIGGRAFRGSEGTAGVGEGTCLLRGLGGERFRFCRRLGDEDEDEEFALCCALLRAGPFTLPLNLLEKLLNRRWPCDERLEAVDWDHRLRFPRPSRTGAAFSCAT